MVPINGTEKTLIVPVHYALRQIDSSFSPIVSSALLLDVSEASEFTVG